MSLLRSGAFWLLGLCLTVWAVPGLTVAQEAAPQPQAHLTGDGTTSEWAHVGRTLSATRFAPLEQIDRASVHRLKVAWTYRSGDGTIINEATPLQIGSTLYLCTTDSIIIALDAERGTERWRYDPHIAKVPFGRSCRGVTYHKSADAADVTPGGCAARIIIVTRDAQLVAVDATTGTACTGFGKNGAVDLRQGMGEVKTGYLYQSSPPTIVGDVVVVGGCVIDGQETNEPSGVVRGYDARTGAFLWAWDMGRPGVNTEPPPGESYTRGTPNVWSIGAADPELGLVYLPTGNATPDYYGAYRTPEMDAFASSIVALDVKDGSVRWHFQTTHHDIWDYDVAPQPVLVDFPTAEGVVPAVIQPTKRGELFVLDRRTGKPLAQVEERPAPQSGAPGERLAPTQPFSVGMPSVAGNTLTEADMWGITPLDQLWCRIQFRRARYDGPMTPIGVDKPIIRYPGYNGGSNWGSVSLDESRGILVVYNLHLANYDRLIPRDSKEAAPYLPGLPTVSPSLAAPQRGVPYVATNEPFFSPLQVPCQRPPFGKMTAIDLKTKKVIWDRPIGTTRKSGPYGIGIRIPLPMGVPMNGGSLVTKAGLIFYAGSQDGYIRALDTETGHELWRSLLPVPSQATPMSYISPESGRQFVVVTAAGPVGLRSVTGNYVVGYTLASAK